MSQYEVRFKPNWLPSLNPVYVDLTDRLLTTGIPNIQQGIARRENPFLLTYGELSLTFDNADGFFDPLFDLDKIIGTDLLNLRAPLLHYGRVLFSRREFGRPKFQNIFFGFLDPKTIKFNRDASTCSFTAWGVAKMLEKGNAERVHRFAYLYPGGLPQPYVLSGYDLVHPAAPAGAIIATGTVATNQTFNPDAFVIGTGTRFTREISPGNTITINGVSAVVSVVDSDTHITLFANWTGATTTGATMFYSGPNNAVFRLSRDPVTFPTGPEAATLQFFPGDTFNAVARVLPSAYSEGMDLTDLGGAEFIIKSTTPIGNDLVITLDEQIPDFPLIKGQASIQVITPWWQGKRYTDLIRLLIAETNAALAAAGYPDVLQLVQDPFSSTTGAPILDLIDEINLPFPSSGIAWAADGAVRALLQGSGSNGIKKPDILFDAIATERTLAACTASTAVSFTPIPPCGGAALKVTFPSADTGKQNVYANPSLQLAGGIPAIERTLIPQVGPDLHVINSATGPVFGSRIGSRWTVVPSAYTRALPTTLCSAYRLEYIDGSYQFGVSDGMGGCNPETVNIVGYVLGRYTTVDNGATWVLVNQDVTQRGGAANTADTDMPPVNKFAQGGLQLFPVAGGFLYLLTDGGRMKPSWALRPTDIENPTVLVPLLAQLQDGTTYATNAGNRSGAVFDGTNVFYFEDQGESESFGIGTLSIPTGPSVIVTGVGTRFLRDIQPGDVLYFFDLDADPNYLFPVSFVVATVVSDTILTIETANPGPLLFLDFYRIRKQISPVRFWYWDAGLAQMKIGTLVGFPVLNGADFAHAFVDSSRQHLYVVQGRTLYRIAISFASGVLTALNVFSAVIDTPNYDAGVGGSHVAALAWLAGPIDTNQGVVGDEVTYPLAGDSILVGTILVTYVYSDAFAGIIKIADFTGMSCSKAIENLIIIPQQAILSGADLATVAEPQNYTPIPTVFLRRRIVTTATPFDAVAYAVACQDELWIIQYNSVLVQNSNLLKDFQGTNIPTGSNINTGAVGNDRQFIFDGVAYKVLAARYGGSSALTIDNPFVFSTSVAKMIANAFAFELLIPRGAALTKISDPFLIDGVTILQPLQRMTYLKRAPNAYGGAQVATGKIIKMNYQLENNNLDIEVA